jgi:hypothetical protein
MNSRRRVNSTVMFLPLTNVMKPLAALCLLMLLAFCSASAQSQSVRTQTYPNELPGYRFYPNAKWKSLEPLVSTSADVHRLLGNPRDAHDVTQYTKPYPGDASAKEPVLTYDIDDNWELLVYFVRYCFYDGPALPESLGDRLCTMDLIPKKRMPFNKIKFPQAFTKTHVAGVDAAWDAFADGSGLVYQVYSTNTPYGNKQPGDLFRITYGPSNETLARYAKKSQ